MIRRDVFQQIAKVIDSSEPQPEETYQAILRAWGDEPELDVYQDYK